MIDLTPRPDRYAPGEAPEPRTVDQLIQARIDGRISRRGLVRRAAALGIAAPVVGVMLHATSDHVLGAPNPGRSPRAVPAGQETVPVEGPTAPQGTPREGGAVTVGAGAGSVASAAAKGAAASNGALAARVCAAGAGAGGTQGSGGVSPGCTQIVCAPGPRSGAPVLRHSAL